MGFQQGDEEALADAYRRWSGLVYATSLKATGNPEDAADITQAVFVNAWRGRAGFRPGGGVPLRMAHGHHQAPHRRPLGGQVP